MVLIPVFLLLIFFFLFLLLVFVGLEVAGLLNLVVLFRLILRFLVIYLDIVSVDRTCSLKSGSRILDTSGVMVSCGVC